MIPKFRAWDKLRKRMSTVDRIYFDTEGVQLRDGSGLYWRDFRNIALMQSTGLKDKNGVEIFEGDLLSRNGEMPHIVKFGQWTCEGDLGYKIRNIGFYIDSSYDNTEWFQTIDYKNTPIKFEVLGNIYENPKLMEVKE